MPNLVPDVAGEGGAPVTSPEQAAAGSKLFSESQALYVGQLKAALEKTADEPSVCMHHLDREDRKDSIECGRLAPGFIVDGKFDPSFDLVNTECNRVQQNRTERVD